MFLILMFSCIPASLMNTYEGFLKCLWVVVFAISFIEPVFTGILLNTVSAPERPTASSVSIFIEMTFGLLPAPYTYGLITEYTIELDPVTLNNVSRWGMRIVTLSSIIGGVALLLAIILRSRIQHGSTHHTRKAIKKHSSSSSLNDEEQTNYDEVIEAN